MTERSQQRKEFERMLAQAGLEHAWDQTEEDFKKGESKLYALKIHFWGRDKAARARDLLAAIWDEPVQGSFSISSAPDKDIINNVSAAKSPGRLVAMDINGPQIQRFLDEFGNKVAIDVTTDSSHAHRWDETVQAENKKAEIDLITAMLSVASPDIPS